MFARKSEIRGHRLANRISIKNNNVPLTFSEQVGKVLDECALSGAREPCEPYAIAACHLSCPMRQIAIQQLAQLSNVLFIEFGQEGSVFGSHHQPAGSNQV